MALSDFIPKEGQARIVDAIGAAERRTSGEIRVHIEPRCKSGDPYRRAIEVFNELKMYETRQRNAVLVYVAYRSHMFAIIGDSGINEHVPADFWNSEKETLAGYLRQGDPAGGLCEVIRQIGESLSAYFPWTEDDINEQSNEISYYKE